MYQTKLPTTDVNGKLLLIPNLHDRAYIQIGQSYVGVLDRNGANNLTINLPYNKNVSLFIIVENMGRLNFGNNLLDNKVGLLAIFRTKTHLNCQKKNYKFTPQ